MFICALIFNLICCHLYFRVRVLKPVGVIEQLVMVTGSRADVLMCLEHIPTRDAIKGLEVGSGSPNYRLTKVVSLLPDESIFRSVRVFSPCERHDRYAE
jgi:hypothetical protein